MRSMLRLAAAARGRSPLGRGCQRDATPSAAARERLRRGDRGPRRRRRCRAASRRVNVAEGARVEAGATCSSTLATTDVDLALQRARAERAQADAQVRLLQAGSRPEDIQQAEAQVAAAIVRSAGRRGRTRRGARPTRRGSSSCCRTRPARRSSATTPSRDGSWRRRGSRRPPIGVRAAAPRCDRAESRRAAGGDRRRRARASPPSTPDRDARARPRRRPTIVAPIGRHRDVAAGRARRTRRGRHAARRDHRSRSRVGERLRRRAARADAADRSAGDRRHRRRRSAGRAHRVHLPARGVHAAQRADGGRARQARVSREGHRRQHARACSSRACRSRSSSGAAPQAR